MTATPTSLVAFITGGASGIGLAIARHLSAKNWNIAIFDYNEKYLHDVLQELDGDRVLILKGDVTNYASQGEAVAKTWDTWHRLDFVFANAGIVDSMDFYAPATESLAGVEVVPAKPNLIAMDINLTGAIYTSYLAMHFFRRNPSPGGELVFTASEAG
jgi:15-hydroxyprostaglandin dehydrogenase (NAD)